MIYIVKERIHKGDIKICDSCSCILTGDTIGVEGFFITEHGLVCADCVCRIKPIRVNQEDRVVRSGRAY